jgi:hypothetical protein
MRANKKGGLLFNSSSEEETESKIELAGIESHIRQAEAGGGLE